MMPPGRAGDGADEDACAGAGRGRRRGGRGHRPRAGPRGLGDAAGRARRADGGLHLARGGALALLQHELRRDPHPRPLDPPLQDPGGRDWAQPWLPGRRQPAHGADRGADGRVPPLRLHRRDLRRAVRVALAPRHRRSLPARARRGSGRRHPPPDRRLHQPGRCHPGAGEGRERPRGRDRAALAGRRLSLDRLRMGRHAHPHGRARRQPRADRRAPRDHRRARRHRHRQPRPAHRAPAGHQDPRHPRRAPVHRHRARPRARRLAARQPPAPGAARRRRQVVRARGAGRLDPGPLRAGRPRALRPRRPRGLPRRSVPARPRPDREGIRVLHPPHPVRRDRGTEGRLQRPDLLHPRRQPADRPGAGAQKPVARRGVLLRDHGGGRRGALPRADDDRRGGRDRHGLDGPAPLRALDHHRLRGRQERGGLLPRLRPPPPRRGAPGRAPAQDRALLRADARARRAVRLRQRLGAAELLRARGRARGLRPRRPLLPPRRLVGARARRGRGGAGRRGPDRRHRLRQAHAAGARRRAVPRLADHQPAAEARPDHTDLRADRGRHRPQRVHPRAHRGGRLHPDLRGRLAGL